jgi:hypothetical protein
MNNCRCSGEKIVLIFEGLVVFGVRRDEDMERSGVIYVMLKSVAGFMV